MGLLHSEPPSINKERVNTIDPPSIFSQVSRELGVLQRQGTHSQSQETTSAHDCRNASRECIPAVQGSSS